MISNVAGTFLALHSKKYKRWGSNKRHSRISAGSNSITKLISAPVLTWAIVIHNCKVFLMVIFLRNDILKVILLVFYC